MFYAFTVRIVWYAIQHHIAHISGSNVVGAFTVIVDGERVPSEYRKFILSKQVNDDVTNLGEILNRRLNHTEWTYPDIIVVDGNDNGVGIDSSGVGVVVMRELLPWEGWRW